MLLDGMERFQGARARPHIQQHRVRARAIQQPVGLFGGLRHLRVESERLCHIAAGLADGAIVVHN